MHKITIVGAGRVGESTAQVLAKEELCREVMLIDVREGAAEGTALDIQECAPRFGFDTRVHGTTDPAGMAGSDLVIVTAGLPRKPGMSRSDVLGANLPIIDAIVDDALRHAPGAMLLMVTNPVDVLTYRAWTRSGWDRKRVFGQAGVLDASRMASFIAQATGFSVRDINALVLGGHGDAMVPMVRYTTISGLPIEHFLDSETTAGIVDRTRQGGAEILALKKSSSAYDAPAAAITTMVDAISRDRRRILPCVAILEGEYGQHDIAMGVPALLGAGGLEKVIELALNAQEAELFRRSVQHIRADLAKC
ncbi:MAG: malate dehydrogenase [Gammaproteobacteria bacterium]|nr:malate dehydrogenase [Gammaproteobacteria bacterium]